MLGSGAIRASRDYVQAILRTGGGSRKQSVNGTARKPGTRGVPGARSRFGRRKISRDPTYCQGAAAGADNPYAEAGVAQQRIAEILGPRRFAQMHSSLELLTERLAGSLTIP